MKKIALPFISLITVFSSACNSGTDEKNKELLAEEVAAPDSLVLLHDTADATGIRHSAASLACFRKLYEELDRAPKATQAMRVLHYGDSQLEADRITNSLRQALQQDFGGCGVGLIPVSEVSEARICVYRQASGNWSHDDLKAQKPKPGENKLFGYNCSVQHFSAGAGADYSEAWVRLKPNTAGRTNEQKAERVRLFYRNAGNNSSFTLQDDTSIVAHGDLETGNKFSIAQADLKNASFRQLQLTLSAGKSPDVIGVSLEGKSGVVVDNLSLRGSSAVEFVYMDTVFLAEQFRKINPRMIILQFGTNLIPHVVDNYDYYEKQFARQLGMFRRILPDCAILVVSVPDMARKTKGKYASYPNIPAVLKAQQRAAASTGCAFWNLHEVMGGTNSILTWKKNGMANNDFIHFSNKGAEHVGTLIYQAIIKDKKRLQDFYSNKNGTQLAKS